MTFRSAIYSVRSVALLLVMGQQVALAQEVEDEVLQVAEVATVEPPISPNWAKLLYIDTPVPIVEGLDFVLPASSALVVPLDEEAFSLRMESIRQYSSTVEDIESLGGTWDRGLPEELSSLGELQQQQGDHLLAVETFDRAIHINRINSGLHTLEQIPAIEQLIESHLAMGNWEQADIYNNYLFYIQQKSYGRNDPRLIPVLDKLATWNMQAFNIGYGELLGQRLRQAQILFVAAARMVGTHFGREDERFVAYMKNIANSSYLLSRNPNLMMELEQPDFRSYQTILMDSLTERSSVLPPGFRSGEKALSDIVQFYQESGDSAYDLAEAIANLGDWYLVFDRRREANDHYQAAWLILQEEENSEELSASLFGQVVALPAFSETTTNPAAVYQNGLDSEVLSYDFVELTLDVSEAGTVRNARVVSEETEENSMMNNRVRSTVRSSYFRPLIVDGMPQRSNGHRFRYRYWY